MMDVPLAREQQTMFPASVVGFFFSFRIFILPLMVSLFQVDPQVGVIATLALNYILLVAIVFHSIGPARTTLKSLWGVRPFRWVLVFLGFSFLSLFWTVSVSVPTAFAYWCAMAADVAMVVLLLRTGPEDKMSFALMKGYVIGACLMSLIAWMLPAQEDLRLGFDDFLGPNQIGYICAFAVFLAQYLILKGGKQWKLPAAFLAITLLRSLSKTTIIAFLIAQVLILARSSSISRRTKFLTIICTCLVVAVFWNLLSAYYEFYTNTGTQSESLTGRTGIWAYMLIEAVQKPWIGHGFHSVWKVIPPFGEFEARHAHNELIQQFYAYGAAGIFMIVALYGSFYRHVRKLPISPLRTLFVGLLLFVVIRGFADTEAFDLSLPLWGIALIGITITRLELSVERQFGEAAI